MERKASSRRTLAGLRSRSILTLAGRKKSSLAQLAPSGGVPNCPVFRLTPECGASAILIASRALAEVTDRGWFGKVQKGKHTGTANAGVIHGGEATNQVTHHVIVRGESRSHNSRFTRRITEAYRTAFERAARRVRNVAGEHGRVEFVSENDYLPFCLSERAPVVRFTQRVAAELGLKTTCVAINGGLDANPLNANGIPTVTLGVGAHCPHAYDEYVDLVEFQLGCRLTLALATAR